MTTICEKLQSMEEKYLAPYALKSSQSRGREIQEEADSIRTCFMRDRDRIIHSKSFRRLKHKTQVYISPENDHYRTRLTHTLEVSQISCTIGKALGLNTDLVEAIALGHDVGHTPFSHTGEEVLDRLLPGGFRHNENSVRVLKHLEQGKIGFGLNLCQETLTGILLHSGLEKEDSEQNTLEGQVVRFADKIAYIQHDIDDSIRAGVLQLSDIPKEYLELLGQGHSDRIATLVQDIVQNSSENISNGQFKISLSPPIQKALIGLREFMFDTVYLGSLCIAERQRAIYVIEFLFDYYVQNYQLLPSFYLKIAEEEGIERGVTDYISGMTDNYCITVFKKIVIPRSYIQMN